MSQENEILEEGIVEIIVLIDSVLSKFYNIQKSKENTELETSTIDSLMRDIHSIKGNMGMLGFLEQSKMVHQIETFLLEVFKQGDYSKDLLDTIIDFWEEMLNSIENNSKMPITSLNNCFSCFKRNKNMSKNCFKIQIKKQEPVKLSSVSLPKLDIIQKNTLEKLLIIGKSSTLESLLKMANLKFSTLNCITQIYAEKYDLKDIHTIYIDVPSVSVNPFLLQHVFNSIKKEVKFAYLVNTKNDLLSILDEIDNISFSFCVISYTSKKFEHEIKELALKCIA